ncbi:MAG TPA: hypothetical protein VF331_12605 [Polyangiales bacterium]
MTRDASFAIPPGDCGRTQRLNVDRGRRVAAPVWSRRITAALLVAAGCLWSSGVCAQSDDERARTHFEAGRAYYDEARYDDAAREFDEAYRLSNRPALLLNLSQAFERALHFDLAIAVLQRYLQMLPAAPDRKTVEGRIAHLQELQQRLAASNAPAPQQPQAAPQPAAAPAQLQPAPQPAAAAAPAAATAPEDSHHLRVPAFILFGTGGAAVIGAVITGLLADSKYSSLSTSCKGTLCKQSAQSDIDSGKSLALVSTVLTGVGIAAAGTGLVLLLLDGKHDGEQPPAGHVRLSTGPTGLGLGAALAF